LELEQDVLHFEDEVISFLTVRRWIKEDKDLDEKELKLLGDYLSRKQQVKDSWQIGDRKKFLRAKRFLASQDEVLDE
jgi:hypothetical protein